MTHGLRLPGYWPLLFPLTYVIHIAEEYYGGQGFSEWSRQYLAFQLGEQRFLALNGLGWFGMGVASMIAVWNPSARWIVVPLAAVTTINGCAHAVASVVTASYSPGVISGVTLWVPLGAITLWRSHRDLQSRLFWTGIGVGIVLHGIVTLLALAG